MIFIKRTDSGDPHFQAFVKELDLELKERDGEDHAFYAQFNKTASLKHVVIAYDEDQPVGCGALREYAPGIMEIKRMYVAPGSRGQGIASTVLNELEGWCRELHIEKCILETGINQPEAIHLYGKNNYQRIPNYGQYQTAAYSVCFSKELD